MQEHHQRNRNPRVPDPKVLAYHRQQQLGGLDNDETLQELADDPDADLAEDDEQEDETQRFSVVAAQRRRFFVSFTNRS